ncbi:hypothetical protein HanIR_Chr04g0152271 [Helianthus annuus]|nr:hypothetical protein HanIR_Chr04g0152271 [Helianthus annuus]
MRFHLLETLIILDRNLLSELVFNKPTTYSDVMADNTSYHDYFAGSPANLITM